MPFKKPSASTASSTLSHPTLHPARTPSGHEVRPRRRGNRLNPTHLEWEIEHPNSDSRTKIKYNSRDARKGRFPLRSHHHAGMIESHPTSTISIRVAHHGERDKLKPHLKLDVTFWVAVAFWWGSAVWVANGFCVWLPVVRPSTDSEAMAPTASALAFIGGTIFLVGAYLGLLEAGNRGKENDFGSSFESLIWGNKPSAHSVSSSTDDFPKSSANHEPSEFSWMPKPRWKEMGYIAAAVQMFAASVFWISTLTGLPGVIPGLADGTGSRAIIDVFFWSPQVVGGLGFIISSLILTIEVQPRWYHLKPLTIGWQVGVWNLVGSVGFCLCGALGYSVDSRAVWQSDMSTYWGSWGFLIGSTFQLYEAVWRMPESSDK
ncbi:hypothetical protein [Phaffia rhodozyma]|uniref:Integral membrane protein n=1 Tax=Phaffia rhodozyma TaxID=264483 RepID=A0A0F7SHV0_PHARH|nr:hypothetical protein [Phaffia rhodozyma]